MLEEGEPEKKCNFEFPTKNMHKLFDVLLAPLNLFFVQESANIDKKCHSKKLLFADFSKKILYALQQKVDSLHTLVTDLNTKDLCKDLGFSSTPFSTLKDGFTRFKAADFAKMYQIALSSFDWLSVKAFEDLGTLCLIDGSLFPTLIQIAWTEYKTTANACKLHVCFELNRMIPTEFLVTSGNFSERKFLISIAKAGVTYIADRGYFSFDLVETLSGIKAFFVLRIKSNVLFTLKTALDITHSVPMPACFEKITDAIIIFNNDPQQREYRLITLIIARKYFRLCTNRFDLNTLQIIMLYAFRWQIELLFKFLKRTLNGIHLYNQSRNGVQIHFYLLLTLALLQMRLKQSCQIISAKIDPKIAQKQENTQQPEDWITYFGHNPADFIQNITQNLYLAWKISKQWLQIINNSLTKTLDLHLIIQIAET